MKLKTYHAYTMAEALAAVRRDLGADAVVLHTRSFKRGRWFRVFRRPVIEVTATPAPAQSTANGAPQPPAKVRLRDVQAQKAYRSASAAVTQQKSSVTGHKSEAADALDKAQIDRQRTQRLAMALEEARGRKPVSAAPKFRAEPKLDTPPRHHVLAAAPPPAPGRAARRFILTSPDQLPKPGLAGSISATLKTAEANTANAQTSVSNVVSTPAAGPLTNVHQMQDELQAIRNMVGQVLQRQVGSSSGPAAPMPGQLFDVYLKLIAQDISNELAEQIVSEVRAAHSELELENERVARMAVRNRLAELIPVASETYPFVTSDGRPLIMAMVGPTGVGKTTTLAKLAATFKLNHGKSVGLITADTYRIAAVDQLRTYADILGLPMHVALTPAEMKRAVQSMNDRDVILIDTAGRSQRDSNRISELKRFISAANPHQVHLVLSSTAGEKVLIQEAQAFSEVGVHKIVLTKLDEAVTFGVLVNAIRQIGKQLSYVTTGQEVPDHIEVGSAERLADLVLGGQASSQPSLEMIQTNAFANLESRASTSSRSPITA